MATAPFWITGSLFVAVGNGGPLTGFPPSSRRSSVMKQNSFEVEALDVERMDANREAWADLIMRALEPNAFFEPAFAVSAARHLPPKSRPLFIAVWRGASGIEKRRLVALCPILAPTPLFGNGVARGWLHKQATLATPLFDRTYAKEAIEALLAWFAQNRAAVVFPKIPMDGPTFAALTLAAQQGGRQWRVFDRHERAVLFPGGDPDELWTRRTSRKALKELHRLQRRLNELGSLEHRRFSTLEDVRRATENFLALEAAGWKGKRGAFLRQPSLATFVRSATRLLAREGKCHIHSLELEGRPIAMGIVIKSRGRAYFWKIAYDETLRSQAPGIQLAYALTKTQTAQRDLDMTDSCAIAHHPMIDRVWPDRLAIGDLMIQTRPDRADGFSKVCGREELRRKIRSLVKNAANRLLNRKVS